MSAFRTSLQLEEVRDRADPVFTLSAENSVFRLLAPLVYFSDLVGHEITVPAGFETDFASVPRLPFLFLLAGGEANEPAVIHDWLYHSHEVPRAMADAVLEEAMAVAGQPWWRRKLMWLGVRIGGAKPYAEDFQPKETNP